jgi:flagellar basal-body rod protein FlgB
MLNRIANHVDFQSQALLLRSERQRLIASNIANADTPGYQARDFDFAAALRDATRGMPAPGRAPSAVDANALGSPIARGSAAFAGLGSGAGAQGPRLNHATAAQSNLDGNTVDMDRERASFTDNAVRFEATLRFIGGTLRTLQDAMKSHTGA